MTLLELYLIYLQEREYDEPTRNPDSFDIELFKNLLTNLDGIDKMKKIRHSLQPSLFDIYIKNTFGDYKGRPDMMNSKTMKHVGFAQFKADMKELEKRSKFASSVKDKMPKTFISGSNINDETNDPDTGYDSAGGDGGGGD